MEDNERRLSDELDVLALDLRTWFEAVSTLHERNVPPSAEIAKRALALRGFFDTLRSRIADLPFAAEVSFATPVLEVDNPAALKECLLGIAAARALDAERRGRACDVLGGVLRIAHRDRPDWEPLGPIRSEASALQAALQQGSKPELRNAMGALIDGTHPLAQLVRFISDRKLEDNEWETLRSRILELFGDELAISAARGRLSIVPPSSSAPVAQPVSAERTPGLSASDQPLETSRGGSPSALQAEGSADIHSEAELSAGGRDQEKNGRSRITRYFLARQ